MEGGRICSSIQIRPAQTLSDSLLDKGRKFLQILASYSLTVQSFKHIPRQYVYPSEHDRNFGGFKTKYLLSTSGVNPQHIQGFPAQRRRQSFCDHIIILVIGHAIFVLHEPNTSIVCKRCQENLWPRMMLSKPPHSLGRWNSASVF